MNNRERLTMDSYLYLHRRIHTFNNIVPSGTPDCPKFFQLIWAQKDNEITYSSTWIKKIKSSQESLAVNYWSKLTGTFLEAWTQNFMEESIKNSGLWSDGFESSLAH